MDVSYLLITPLWKRSSATRARLGEYCLKDSILSLGLATHPRLEMPLGAIELARQTKVIASILLRSGNQAKVQTLVLHAAHNARFASPSYPGGLQVFFPYEIPQQRDREDKFEGAIVIEPVRGAHGPDEIVAVGDFSSLYPSIALAHNICYSTNVVNDKYMHLPHDEAPIDYEGHHPMFVKKEIREGLLPIVFRSLLDGRAAAKRKMKESEGDPDRVKLYDSRQLGLKIVANSIYGCLTASGGWFVRMSLGMSITGWGRSMIHQVIDIATNPPYSARCIGGVYIYFIIIFFQMTNLIKYR